MSENCIFCKIIKGDIPSMKVYEDDSTLAFMDIGKDVDGHIVVIPKKHVKNILDCDNDTLTKLMANIKKISEHLTNDCGYNGINLLNNSGECAGQAVPHFHFHIIPRKTDDGVDCWPKFTGAKSTIEEIHNKIKMI